MHRGGDRHPARPSHTQTTKATVHCLPPSHGGVAKGVLESLIEVKSKAGLIDHAKRVSASKFKEHPMTRFVAGRYRGLAATERRRLQETHSDS